MISDSTLIDYGRVIARRYVECVNPLESHIVRNPEAAYKEKFSERDLAFAGRCVTQSAEVVRGFRDAHGRLDETQAPHGRESVVDDLLLKTVEPCRDRKLSIIFTHDVDRSTLWEGTAILHSMRHRFTGKDLTSGETSTGSRFAIEKTIDRLLSFEIDHNIHSIFFFLSGPYSLARYGSRANIGWKSARRIMNAVQAARMAVGLHGSYYAKDKDSYEDECKRIEDIAQEKVLHHRNHYLRYDSKNLWSQLEKCGITYDHSVGFSHGWGFRTGTSVPYPAYNLAEKRLSKIIEIPMLLMDGAWSTDYNAETMSAIRDWLGKVRRHHGCVSLNFHPESLVRSPAAWKYFRDIVSACEDLGADMKADGFVRHGVGTGEAVQPVP